MMKAKYIILFLVIVSTVLSSCNDAEEKTGYLNIGRVYSEFSLSEQLSAEREVIENKRQGILDTMELQLNALSSEFKYKTDSSRIQLFQNLRQDYYYKEKQFQEDNQALFTKHDEQVMKQLNQYIEDFGKENGYKYIYGANGNGSLMYADENADVSEEVITYVNEKYRGVK